MAEKQDLEAVEKLNEARNKIKNEIKKVIVGQERVIDELLIALLSNGHCLLIGVPGLAKTLMISTISRIL
ncbi:MAG: AAA family ATPase, partial [candidate division Zixibacteria bacterium]|nr:AAA family ATPase [candidate division Zixibacteria bacterium]